MEEKKENAVIVLEDDGKSFALKSMKDMTDEQKFLDADLWRPVIGELKQRCTNLVADEHTKDGVIARKSLKSKLGKLKTDIEAAGKRVAAELKAKPKKIDATRKVIKDSLEAMQEQVMAPIVAIERRQAEIVEISNVPASAIGADSAGIRLVLDSLNAKPATREYWQESYDEAILQINEARRQLNDMYSTAKNNEDLLARAKQLEDDAKKKAEEDRKALEDKLKETEEQVKTFAAENIAAVARAEAAENVDLGQSDEASTRAAMLFPDDDREYRRQCNREALEDLKALGIAEDKCKAVITAIVNGRLRHVRLIYTAKE